jgi:hypothetical protein
VEANDTTAATAATPAEPFERAELQAALRRPHLAIPLLLSERARLMATIDGGEHCACLALVMFTSSLLFALPYGFALGVPRLWHVAMLYLGSVAICLPSLHVFGAFLGVRSDLQQSLALGLVISSAAAMFSFGFAPVFAFLSLTMGDPASGGALQALSALLLCGAVLAGGGHLMRALRHGALVSASPAGPLLLLLWQGLLFFITFRMGRVLELL